MQKKHLFWSIPGSISLLIFFLAFLPLIHLEKVYQYDVHTSTLAEDTFTPVPSQVASLFSRLPVEYSYIQTGSLTFDAPRTTIYLSFDNSISITQASDIQVEWFLDGERFSRVLDIADTPVGMEGSSMFTFPFVAPLFSTIEYRISSRVPLESSQISVISSDNSAFTESITFGTTYAHADDNPAIVSRREWGADENLRYISEWRVEKNKQAYIARGSQSEVVYETASETTAREKNDLMYSLSRDDMPEYTQTVSKIRTENGRKLAWPIERVRGVYGITIHHTAESMQKSLDDMTVLRAIYQYHAISRGWGDIGYNYIIGQRGQIYEGRAGGDYVVGAHAAWNNAGTVGVSVMGNFEEMNVNRDQETGLKSAIVYLAQKYGINLNSSVPGVRVCNSASCEYFENLTNYALMGHRDVGVTSCPGEALYEKLAGYRETLAPLIGAVTPVWNTETPYIEPLAPEDVVLYIPKTTNTFLTTSTPQTTQSPVTTLTPNLTPPVQNASLLSIPTSSSLPVGRTIQVKLSYPTKNTITLQSATNNRLFLVVDNRRILVPYTQSIAITTTSGGLLEATTGTRKFQGTTLKIEGVLIRVPSWSRVPAWDTTGKYNDNIFRTQLIVRNEENNILLVNALPVESYLRGMGEVSESDAKNYPEKVKTIIVGARSYASYYSNPGLPDALRKFPGKPYDLSDNPDEAQRYLGYGYELRSPTVSTLVDATNSEVVTYNGSVVKVWYSSSTNGRTRSYLEYCQSLGKTDCEDIPYLQSVDDPGAQGNNFLGHGVGISGVGATYFARLGWKYTEIIQYYLTGVAIQKL